MERPMPRFLFDQLPTELNLLILNLLKPDEWIRVSSTCKRWENNTKFITDLELIVTHKKIRVPHKTKRRHGGRPLYVIAHLNLQGISTTLDRFAPENLHSLLLTPDVAQNCAIVNEFIARCTRLRSLECPDSTYLFDAIGSLTQLKSLRLKGLTHGDKLRALFKQLTKLEELEFTAKSLIRSKLPIDDQFYLDLVNLKSLKINDASTVNFKYACISNMTRLTELNLFSALITDDEFKHFADLTNLETLSLSDMQRAHTDDELSDKATEVIGNADPLNGLRHLTRLSKLKHLDISDLERLWSLDDSYYENRAEPTIIDLANIIQRHLTNLKVLKIGRSDIGERNKESLKQIKNILVIGHDVDTT